MEFNRFNKKFKENLLISWICILRSISGKTQIDKLNSKLLTTYAIILNHSCQKKHPKSVDAWTNFGIEFSLLKILK